MSKVIVTVLGLACVGGVLYYVMERSKASAPQQVDANGNMAPGLTQPARQLDNVRGAAHRIEVQGQQRADGVTAGSAEQ